MEHACLSFWVWDLIPASGFERPWYVFIYFCFLAALIMFFLFLYKRRTSQRAGDVWFTVAKVIGLSVNKYSYEQGVLRLEGVFDGREIRVLSQAGDAENSPRFYTEAISMLNNPLEQRLYIRPQSWADDKIIKTFNLLDLDTDDPEFNRSFIVKSDSERFPRVVLTKNIRELLVGDLKNIQLTLEGNRLISHTTGLELNGEKIIALVGVNTALCKNIEDFSGN